MKANVIVSDEIINIILTGTIKSYTDTIEIGKILKQHENYRNVKIDIKDSFAITSSFISKLMHFNSKIQNLTIHTINKHLLKLFDTLGLEKILNIIHD